jgi:hypothetical protein
VRTVLVLALGLCLMGFSACGGGQACPHGCPAAGDTANVIVTTTPAMAVNGTQATLAGPVTGTMSCQPDGTFTLCRWPPAVVVTPGIYTLRVSAPGYQPMTTLVAVTISPVTCGCTMANIEPLTVALSPSDGGVD